MLPKASSKEVMVAERSVLIRDEAPRTEDLFLGSTFLLLLSKLVRGVFIKCALWRGSCGKWWRLSILSTGDGRELCSGDRFVGNDGLCLDYLRTPGCIREAAAIRSASEGAPNFSSKSDDLSSDSSDSESA